MTLASCHAKVSPDKQKADEGNVSGDEPAAPSPPKSVSLCCGMIAGLMQAGLFSPYDRALYLSVKHHRPFLSSSNFHQPYQGFFQSVGGRAISAGLYFPLERAFLNLLVPAAASNEDGHDGHADSLGNFLAGTAAGAMNAILLNPLSALKYKTWGREINRGMVVEAKRMWTKGGGPRPFFNGLLPTLYRDVTFGGCYTYLRYAINGRSGANESESSSGTATTTALARHFPAHYPPWVGNLVAAAVATIVSGPFNLARNVQYATRSKHQAPSILQVLTRLADQVASQQTLNGKLHLLQNRLRIGWGTARVAVGMAFGNFVYDECMSAFERHANKS